jgi:hypothetical protein
MHFEPNENQLYKMHKTRNQNKANLWADREFTLHVKKKILIWRKNEKYVLEITSSLKST